MANAPIRASALETKTYTVVQLQQAIKSGRVRVPRFQRAFRWGDEDRRLLFDSIAAGYPIGTLLLAAGRAPKDRVALGGYAIDVPEATDALWVVDGQQRVSTLAMALLEDHSGTYRPIYFDLETDHFVLGVRRRAPRPLWLPTTVLSSSAATNRWLRENDVSDAHADRADEIAGRVREYSVPAYLVPYDGQDDRALREIFRRVNQHGRALESSEVFQAMHASVDGGLPPLDRVAADLVGLRFGTLERTSIERAAVAVGGYDPGRSLDAELGPDADVAPLLARVTAGLIGAIEFLATDVGCIHQSLLPYEGALFTLARFFDQHPKPHPRNRELLGRWFWRGVISKAHRTDYSLDRRNWKAIGSDEDSSVRALLALLPVVRETDLPTELEMFRRNFAQSRVELLALLALEPASLVGVEVGALVPAASLLDDEPARIPSLLVKPGPGVRKTAASYVLHEELDVSVLIARPTDEAALATHAIDPLMMRALRAGDDSEFLRLRAAKILAHVQAFLREGAALDAADRDHPPLDSYLTGESA